MEGLDKDCCFPTDDEMAAQLEKCCPVLRDGGKCEGCFVRKRNQCPLGLYSAFLTGVKVCGWNLCHLKTRCGM